MFFLISFVWFVTLSAQHCEWGMSSRQGDRLTMEDTIVANGNGPYFFGIFDGHGGDEAAKLAAHLVPQYFFELQNNTVSAIPTAFARAYNLADIDILQKTDSGSCSLNALVTEQDIWFSWAGDSRGIVIRDGKVIFHTVDHKPNNAREQRYIEQQGGTVEYIYGIARIDGLAISRTLGDKYTKDLGHIIHEPDTQSITHQPRDLIILACDGVWDVLTNEEVACIAQMVLNDPDAAAKQFQERPLMRRHLNKMFPVDIPFPTSNLIEQNILEEGNNKNLILAARAIRDIAYMRGSTDNITVQVIQIT